MLGLDDMQFPSRAGTGVRGLFEEEKNMDALEQLPIVEIKGPCQTCGCAYPDCVPCNIDDEGKVTDCHKCKERMN